MKVREEKLGNDKVIEVTKPVEQETKRRSREAILTVHKSYSLRRKIFVP